MQAPMLALAGVALLYLASTFLVITLPLASVLFLLSLLAFGWAALELVAILTPDRADE